MSVETLEQGLKYVQSKQYRSQNYAVGVAIYFQLWTYFTTCSIVSVVNFDHVNAAWEWYWTQQCTFYCNSLYLLLEHETRDEKC